MEMGLDRATGKLALVRFYHYTCRHSVEAIVADKGTLRPNPNAGWQEKVRQLTGERAYTFPVVWVTDVDVRTRSDAVLTGLSQPGDNITKCLRVEFRFIVPNVGLVPWREWSKEAPEPGYRALLESAGDPGRWWVSGKPIRGCRLDQAYACGWAGPGHPDRTYERGAPGPPT